MQVQKYEPSKERDILKEYLLLYSEGHRYQCTHALRACLCVGWHGESLLLRHSHRSSSNNNDKPRGVISRGLSR